MDLGVLCLGFKNPVGFRVEGMGFRVLGTSSSLNQRVPFRVLFIRPPYCFWRGPMESLSGSLKGSHNQGFLTADRAS